MDHNPCKETITLTQSGKHNRKSALSLAVMLMTLLCTFSCHHPSKPSKEHRKATLDYAALFSRIQGRWISYEYMLNIHQTQSPAQSAPFMEGIFSFTIDSNRLSHDTLHCVAWVNGHIERDLWIAFDSPDSIGQYSIGLNHEAGVEVDQRPGTDNITRIRIDSSFLTIYTSTFDSVRYAYFDNLSRVTGVDYPIRHYTTAALFRGDYFNKDSNQVFGTGHISFDTLRVGRLLGSPIYDSFDINVVLISQNDSVDYMELFDSHKKNESRSFLYSFQKNELLLSPNPESTPYVLRKIIRTDTIPKQ